MLARVSFAIVFISFIARVLLHPTVSDADVFLNSHGTSRVLLLTAHPDDECLFFAPTVTSLRALPHVSSDKQPNVELYSLCLSVGNADGLGETRREELARSLDVLGIENDRRWVVDHPELADNITLHWDEQLIADTLRPYVLDNNITTILTFDRQGVSSHPNHGSLPSGAARLVTSLTAQPPPSLFTLITVPLANKYVGPLAAVLAKTDLAFASLLARMGYYHPHRMPVFVSGIEQYRTALRAMRQHRSQLVWFRWLYVSFSRYMWVNEWVGVVPPTHTSAGDTPSPEAVV